jgi:glycosyltransferase involved in cell wall biosynthesis
VSQTRNHPFPDPEAEAPLGRLTFISWADNCSRSDHTARELGGRSFMVYAPALGSHPATIWLKYLVQWYRTSRLLRREKPDTVFVMSPPLFAALPALWYARRRNVDVVIDAHTCAFVLPRWARLMRLQLAICREARTTFVTNEHLARTIERGGAHATIVPDVPVVFDQVAPFQRPPGFTIAAVCSFDSDEPLEAIFAAARQLPDVHFVMTGNHEVLPAAVKESLSPNVLLTGYLPVADYGGLLSSADAVLDLTTLDHTMLRGAYEAVYQGKPVIVSDWPLLRSEFPIGALHVDNSPASIVRAVQDLRAHYDHFAREAAELRESKARRWQRVRRDIVAAVAGDGPQTHRPATAGADLA